MTKPNIIIPNSFAANGDKTDFDESHITNGFPTLTPDVLRGDNLNKFIDDTYKGLNGVLELYGGCVLYDSTVTYNNKSIVFYINSDDEVEIYRSLINNNLNNPLTDTAAWKKVELGGGGYEINDLVWRLTPTEEAGKHLLDGALLQYGSYKQYIDKMADLYDNTTTKYSNVIKYGSLADSDGVLSGFSSSNWAKLPYLFNPSTSTWEIVVKFTTGNSFGTYEGIIHPLDADYTAPLLELRSGVLTLLLSSNSTSWDITSGLNCGTLQTNTTYWVKIEFTGSAYNVYVSTDGTYSTPVATVSSSVNVYCTKLIKIGDSWNGTYYFNGSIDLNGSYININGSRWWTGTIPSGFTDETTWQSSVAQYGSCGKFVYDSVNNTVRLPKVSDILEGTTDITALGDLVEAGLPNINGYFQCASDYNANGATRVTWAGGGDLFDRDRGGGWGYPTGITLNASWSSAIYGNSTTVQPQTIKGLIYIVIATTTKTDIEVDIDEIATDLNGKCDTDGTNATFPHVVESYKNGNSGYILYSPDENGNKRCIQWGVQAGLGYVGQTQINLLKPLQLPYIVTSQIEWDNVSGWYTGNAGVVQGGATDITGLPSDKTNTTFLIQSLSTHSWFIDGYLYES